MRAERSWRPQMPTLNTFTIAVTAVLTAFVCFGLHEVDVYFIKIGQQNELNAQADKLTKQFNADKEVVTEVSHVYQDELSALNAQLSSLRQHPTCLPTTLSSAGYHGTSGAGEPPNQNAISSDWLYTYAAEAEKYRLQLIGCQSFITQVWKEKAD